MRRMVGESSTTRVRCIERNPSIVYPPGGIPAHPIARKCMDFRGRTADPGPFGARAEPSGAVPNSATIESQVKSHHYSQHAAGLRAELGDAISREQMRDFHQKSAVRHLVVAARQFALLAAATWGLIRFDNPLVWVPLAVVQGFTIFNFTILLHEVVHDLVFERKRPPAQRVLGLALRDPERDFGQPVHAVAPGSSRGARLRRRRSEAASSVAEGQQAVVQAAVLHARPVPDLLPRRPPRIGHVSRRRFNGRSRWERKVSVAAHLTAIGLLWYFFGIFAALRTSIIPVFFVFPIAFTLNRLGQHYDINPDDPAQWGTLMKGHWFWDFAYLNSNYHLEHHYFPGRAVLPAARGAARPGALLRAQGHAVAKLRPPGVRVDRREPRAPHRLEPVRAGRARPAVRPSAALGLHFCARACGTLPRAACRTCGTQWNPRNPAPAGPNPAK